MLSPPTLYKTKPKSPTLTHLCSWKYQTKILKPKHARSAKKMITKMC